MVALIRDDGLLTPVAGCVANLASRFAEWARRAQYEATRRCC